MKNKKNLKRKLRKKAQFLNLILVLIALMIVIFFTPKLISTARYIYSAIHDNYLSSKDFYFSSDKLSLDHTEYQITNNWSGAETYRVTINMSSKENDMASTESDIDYEVAFTCSDNIECTLSKNSGTIVGTNNGGVNEDSFTISINPKNGVTLSNTEIAWVDVTATSTSPYSQEISGKLILEVGSSNIYYEITDSVNSPYLMVNIINSSPVDEDVTLTYSPNTVLLDMTGQFYLNSTANTVEQLNSYNYLNSITSKVTSLSTTSVKFYKNDATQNYTYSPSDTGTPVITLSY